MLLVNEDQTIDMVEVITSDDAKYNLVILDHYDHDVVSDVFREYGDSISAISLYKHGELVQMNGKYFEHDIPTIYVNINGITMYDFVVKDHDIIITA